MDLINKYEAGVPDRSMRDRFMEEFEPKKIGILNGDEIMKDQLISPKFGEMPGGQFLAIEKNGKIFVFPNPVLSANRINIGDQKMAFFVDAPRIMPGQSFHVMKPAIFQKAGGLFERVERGQLRVY